jgi:FkbM family methyltransferase
MAAFTLIASVDLDQQLIMLSQRQSQIYFMQIGSFDGKTNDHLYQKIRKYSLAGVLIEPQPEAFRRLCDNYRGSPAKLNLLNVAIAEHDGRRPLYVVDGAFRQPAWLPQLASFRKEIVLSHRHEVPDLENMIRVIDVECWSFDKLFSKLDRATVDLLYIDAEGYDARLILSFDVPRRKPPIIVFEHKHLQAPEYIEVARMLAVNGYQLGLSQENIHDTIACLM